jgi:hypothetical protein
MPVPHRRWLRNCISDAPLVRRHFFPLPHQRCASITSFADIFLRRHRRCNGTCIYDASAITPSVSSKEDVCERCSSEATSGEAFKGAKGVMASVALSVPLHLRCLRRKDAKGAMMPLRSALRNAFGRGKKEHHRCAWVTSIALTCLKNGDAFEEALHKGAS